MRTEIDEERDVAIAILSDAPIVRTEEMREGGGKVILSFDAQGKLVRTETYEFSKVLAQASKLKGATIQASEEDRTLVNEMSWRLYSSVSGETKEGRTSAAVGNFSIKTVESPERKQQSISFPLDAEYEFALAIAEPAQSLPVGLALTVSRRDRKSFSWEWFQQQESSLFRKIQEDGLISVVSRNIEGKVFIVATELLTDLSLRFKEEWPPKIDDSDEMPESRLSLKKGLVLRWPALIDGQVVFID